MSLNISTNPYLSVPVAQLQAIAATYLQAILDIGSTGESYSVPGRTFKAIDLPTMEATLFKLNQAIGYQGGQILTQGQPIMTDGPFDSLPQ